MLANSGYVMTLANSIIGVGILAMPFCFQKCGIFLAILLLIVSNWITRVCCHYLIKTSLLTRRKSFEFLGFHAFGTSGKLLVELCIIGYLLGTCITYFVVVGDLGPQIVTKMFSLESEHRHLRSLLMWGVTVFCIIPLGMLKKVDSLAAVCTASIGFYVCLVMKIILESETHIIANDWTEKVVYWQPGGVLQCLPIFSMALSCQMQIFEVFTSINNQSLEKLNGIVRNATWICTLVYIAVGFFGYVAFSTQSFSGNILLNLSPSFGSDVIKIGFVLSVAFSFPLVIFPCRVSLYSLLYRQGQTDFSGYIPELRFKAITIFIAIFSLCIALMIPSVELVIGLVGSTIGVAICIMFPAACFRKIIKKDTTERYLAQFVVISGFFLMILGTYANLLAVDAKSSGSHLNVPKIVEDLIKPTEFAQSSIDEKIKTIEEALEAKDKAKEDTDIIGNKLKFNEKPDYLNRSKIVFNENASPAPLPVDERHPAIDKNYVLMGKLGSKSQLNPPPNILFEEKDKLAIVAKNSTENKYVQNNTPNDKKPMAKTNNTKTTGGSLVELQPQTIDNDAIRKDEEVAKEQYKEENEELKKTQKELEKTKDLLEKKVEELKEELVKKNQETQDMVVEKLGKVVEKFEAIERRVQQQNEEVAPLKVVTNIVKKPGNDTNIIKSNNSSLISILTKTKTLSKKSGPSEINDLIENVVNASVLEKRLPLALALLRNASQAKINETVDIKPKITLARTGEEEINTNHKDIEKVDTESLSRKMLPLKSNPEEVTAIARNDNGDFSIHRIKRSYHSVEVDDNCVTEPPANNLVAGNLNMGLEMKIGRDLKSIKEEE